jgi:hypothetical protein
MAVRLSASCAGSALSIVILILIYVRDGVDPRTILYLEGLSKMKKKKYLVGVKIKAAD